MATQSLLWTAVPNGLTEDGTGLRVSVVLSPRLDPAGDPPALATFREWLDWPATLAQAKFELRYGAASAGVTMSQTAGPDRVDDTVGLPDSAAWTALFHEDLPVRGGSYVDHSSKTIVSYEAAGLADYVADLYGTLAASADGELPTVTGLLNAPGWDGLVSAVDRIDDRKHFNADTGLRDTRNLFAEYREHRFERLQGSAAMLARAQLFHTPPSRQVDVVRRARDDDPDIEASWREHEQSTLPAPEDFATQLDFHAIVGAMSSYPTVLRRLGIVVDLVVARDAFADSADAPLSVTVDFPEDALATLRLPDVSPVTHASLSPEGFQAVSDPAPGPADARVADGLLDLDPRRFDLVQMDVDGAGLKLMNFARSLARKARADERVDSVTRAESRLGAPTLRTAGLVLVQRRRAVALEGRFDANAVKNAHAQAVIDGVPGATAPDLYAEELLRGFRIDVWDATSGRWRSLCRREAAYTLGEGEVVVVPAAGEEEGIVRLAATTSSDPATNADLLWLHEAVVSWAGWSLTAPPPGKAIMPDDTVDTAAQTEAALPPGLRFESRFRAVRGSLPRLRYGRRYWLRARAVDLAGNSLPASEKDLGPEDPESQRPPVPALRAGRRTGDRARAARRRRYRAPRRRRVDEAHRDPQLQRRPGRQRRAERAGRAPLRRAAAGQRARGRAARDARRRRGAQRGDVRHAGHRQGSRRARPGGGARRRGHPDAGAARRGRGRHDVRRLPRGGGADAPARSAGDHRRGKDPRPPRRRPRRHDRDRAVPGRPRLARRAAVRDRGVRGSRGRAAVLRRGRPHAPRPAAKGRARDRPRLAATVRQGAARADGRLALGRGADRRARAARARRPALDAHAVDGRRGRARRAAPAA